MKTIQPIPQDYVHPQGRNVAGQFGIFEDGKLIINAPTEEALRIFCPKPDWRCESCGHEFDNESAIIKSEVDFSEYAGTRQFSTVHVVCCPECGSDELEQLS